MSTNYEELAARAERGELKPKKGTAKYGQEAVNAARSQLLAASGAQSVEEFTRMALGRPAVGEKRGPSPVVRARVPQALKDRVSALAETEHRAESDIVRDALAAYVGVKAAS